MHLWDTDANLVDNCAHVPQLISAARRMSGIRDRSQIAEQWIGSLLSIDSKAWRRPRAGFGYKAAPNQVAKTLAARVRVHKSSKCRSSTSRNNLVVVPCLEAFVPCQLVGIIRSAARSDRAQPGCPSLRTPAQAVCDGEVTSSTLQIASIVGHKVHRQ